MAFPGYLHIIPKLKLKERFNSFTATGGNNSASAVVYNFCHCMSFMYTLEGVSSVAVLQTSLLLMKSLNKTETPIF